MATETNQTPMMRQYHAIKEDYPDCILFFRMGDFYEMFGDDAIAAAASLNIALTTRDKGSKNPMPMCGVPFHAIDTYLPRMIRAGHKVAICEQMEDPREAKGIVKREVIRVVTSGTLMEESMLDESAYNYLVAVAPFRHGYGLAAADLSTGLLRVTQYTGPSALPDLIAELGRLDAKQILLPDEYEERHKDLAREMIVHFPKVVEKIEQWRFAVETAKESLKEQFTIHSLDGFGLAEADFAIAAAGATIHYLKEARKGAIAHISRITLAAPGDFMLLDPATVRNLELVKNLIDGGKKGSLLDLMDRSVTPMGARTIREWLLRPLNDVAKIIARLATVRQFYDTTDRRTMVREIIGGMGDLERIAGRVAQKNCSPRDLRQFTDALTRLDPLAAAVEPIDSPIANAWRENWDSMTDLVDFLLVAVAEDPPQNAREGGAVRTGFHAALDELRSIKADSRKALLALEEAERAKTGITTLKVKYNKIYGYFIEVSRRFSDQAPDDWIRKQSLVNAERFISPALKELEEKIVVAEEKAGDLEIELYEAIREKAAGQIYRAQFMAAVVGAIDAFCSFAQIAAEANYVEPTINDSGRIIIEGGRHPIIERAELTERFVPNHTTLDAASVHIAVITGPNMAGKSTYIRQVALITLLAQAGSFVPAKSAIIGVCDRIFTRVGAQDHLQKGQSTFMVEMNETANILNHATSKSLIILDEIGRGTSTYDGLSIAWAVAEYIHKVGARTLFATHYHELPELSETMPGITNLRIAVKEWNDEIIFLRTIVEGSADKSYGIQVARLAGIPNEVIQRAKEVLYDLERRERDVDGKPMLKAKSSTLDPAVQFGLFSAHPASEVEEVLRKTDSNALTPIQALNLIVTLKEKLH